MTGGVFVSLLISRTMDRGSGGGGAGGACPPPIPLGGHQCYWPSWKMLNQPQSRRSPWPWLKIVKIVATKCQILRLKCTKSFVSWGSAPDRAYIVYISSTYIFCNWPLAPPPTTKSFLGSWCTGYILMNCAHSCSICVKKQNRHFIVPHDRFKLLQVCVRRLALLALHVSWILAPPSWGKGLRREGVGHRKNFVGHSVTCSKMQFWHETDII